MNKNILSILILILSISIVNASGLPSQQDIQYNPNDSGNILDWYNPSDYHSYCDKVTPVVIWAHSGGFSGGNEDISTSGEPWKTLLDNCYAIASVRYTLSPAQTFVSSPKVPTDLGRAVQYFRLNSSAYNIDDNKVVAYGRSAGASIWQYVVYGPEMSAPLDANAINKERSRPDLFINNIGQNDWNQCATTVTGEYFGQPTLATVTLGNKLTASQIFMLDTNAVSNPSTLVDTFFIYDQSTLETPPVTDGHSYYFALIGLAKIQQYKPTTTSTIYSTGFDAGTPSAMVTWLNTNLNYSDSGSNQIYMDNFSGYGAGYLIINDFNVTTGWTTGFDANTPVSGPMGRLSYDTLRVVIDVDKSGTNASNISRALDVNYDLSDLNTFGAQLYFGYFTDSNAFITRTDIIIGQDVNNNFSYRIPPASSWVGALYPGYNIFRLDLNAPTVTTGTPNLLDVNYLQVQLVYSASQIDMNWTPDRVWVEAYPNSFDGEWNGVKDGNILYGWGMPFTNINGMGMVLGDVNIPLSSNRGIIIIDPFTSFNKSSYDLNMSVDVNQVDTNWGSKILFDYVNPNNFSSCYIFDLNTGGRKVGLEQVVNGVRSFSEVDQMLSYNTSYNFRCQTSGVNTRLFINGSIVHTASLLSRVNGSMGLESRGGQSNFDNYYTQLITIGGTPLFPYIANNPIIQTTENSLFPILIMALFAGVVIILFLIAMKGGDPNSVILLAVIGIGLLVVYLFFTSIINAVS